MGFALLLARILLAAVFAVAGITKLLDLPGSRKALREFGVPTPVAAPGGLLLPLAEIAVAMLLIPVATARGAALAALLLLGAFVAGIAVTMARGRRPDCHCFGQLSGGPVGWRTLLRNALLAGVAGFIFLGGAENAGNDLLAWRGGSDMTVWVVTGFGIMGVVAGVAIIWLLFQLMGQNGRLISRLDGLEQQIRQIGAGAVLPAVQEPSGPGLAVGSLAPGFQLPGLHGEILTQHSLRASGTPLLLAFVDPGCGPCNALLPDMGRWQRELSGKVTLALISSGGVEENRVKAQEHGLTQVLLQEDRSVSTAYQAYGTPSMVLVRADGTVGSAVAQGAEQIRALVARVAGTPVPQLAVAAWRPPAIIPVAEALPTAAGQPCPNCGKVHDVAPAEPAGIPLGQQAPALKLPDLDGRMVDLADYRGRDVALVFWNPGCGFCQQLLPQLKQWEAEQPQGAPAMLVVSTGETAANQALGLASPVVLQENFQAGSAFGVNGTPAAVLVNRAGAIASAPAVGGPAVLSLLGAPA